MMENQLVFVDFEKHCKTCKHNKLKETLDPCNGCLDNPINENSDKPVCYEEVNQ